MSDTNPRVLEARPLAAYLRSGHVAVIPTDTLPGLACQPWHAKKLWLLKRRPADKPLILMAASAAELFDQVKVVCREDALAMAAQYWPGPLTLVLPALASGVVSQLNPSGSSIGLRIPNCSMTLDLLAASGPLATSSANVSGEPSTLSSNEAARVFPELSLLGPHPWPKPSGLASTVVEWQGPRQWRVLRGGAVIPPGLS